MSPRLEAAFRQTFSSLRSSRNFRLYLSGQFVSAVGTWVNFTTMSWLVWKLTGSGTALGVNSALAFGPVLFLGAWGGVLADRFDKRRILVATQSAFAVVSLTLAVLVFTHAIALWMIYSLSVVSGIINAIDNPARQSFYVEMVGEEVLTNAVSLNSATFTGARMIGPAVAALLIASVGMASCFLVDGLSFFAVLAALLAMRPDQLHREERSTREKGHLVEGLKYVWRTDELRRPLLVMAVVFTLAFQWQVLVPMMAERVFGAGVRGFGAMSVAAGVGSFAAALLSANRNRRPTMRLLGIFAVCVGSAMLLVALSPSLPFVVLAMVPVGFSAMSFMITGNTMLQVTAAPQARGRVMALYGVVFLGSTPIGAPIVGWLADLVDPRVDFFLTALVALVMGLSVLWARQRRIAAEALEPVSAEPVSAEPVSAG
ncbi:MAG: MFS transporter [Actinomycetota bacterium]